MQMKDGRLLKIVLFGQLSRAKEYRSSLSWEGGRDVIKKELKEIGIS